MAGGPTVSEDVTTVPVRATSRALSASLLWTTIRYVATYGAGVVTIPIVTSVLTPTEFGIWTTSATFLAIGGLIEMGMRAELLRSLATIQPEDPEFADILG